MPPGRGAGDRAGGCARRPCPRQPRIGRAGAQLGAERGSRARSRPVHRAGRAGLERDTRAGCRRRQGRRWREHPRPRRPGRVVGRAGPPPGRHIHRRMEERLDRRRPPGAGLLPLLRKGADLGGAGRYAGERAAPVPRRACRPVGVAARRHRHGGRALFRPGHGASGAHGEEPGRSGPPAGDRAGGAVPKDGAARRRPAPCRLLRTAAHTGGDHARGRAARRAGQSRRVDDRGDELGASVGVAWRAGARLRRRAGRDSPPLPTSRLLQGGGRPDAGARRRRAVDAQPDEPRRGHRGDPERRPLRRLPPPPDSGRMGRRAAPLRARHTRNTQPALSAAEACLPLRHRFEALRHRRAERRDAHSHGDIQRVGAGDGRSGTDHALRADARGEGSDRVAAPAARRG